jgi:hypothetical protein
MKTNDMTLKFKRNEMGEYVSTCGDYRIAKWVGGHWRLERLNRRKRTDPWETISCDGSKFEGFYFLLMKDAVKAAQTDVYRRDINRMLFQARMRNQ